MSDPLLTSLHAADVAAGQWIHAQLDNHVSAILLEGEGGT